MGRIGVLGGSFDPVHVGHLELARRALEQVPLDEVWLLPASQPPHKPRRTLAPAAHRRRMLELAIAGLPRLSICTLELDAPGVHYSVETLSTLARLHPAASYWLLMGDDSLDDMSTWREPQRLLRLAAPVVAPRPAQAVTTRRPPPAREVYGVPIFWLAGEPIALSSSGLRAALARRERPAGIPTAVLDYIQAHGLYSAPAAGGSAP